METVQRVLVEFKTDAEKCGPARYRLTAEYADWAVKEKFDEAVKEISRQVDIPGFRKGKVPRKVILSNYGNQIAVGVMQEFCEKGVKRALDENGLTQIGHPSVEDVENLDVKDGEAFKFAFEIDVEPEFETPDYTKIELDDDDTPETFCDKLVEGLEIEIPDSIFTLRTDQLFTQRRLELRAEGLKEKDLVKLDDKIQDMAERNARKEVTITIILARVARFCELEPTQEEITEHVSNMAKMYRMEERQFYDQLKRAGMLDDVVAELKKDKAIQFMMDRAVGGKDAD